METVHPIVEERLLWLALWLRLVAAANDIHWLGRIKFVGKIAVHLGLVRALVAHDQHLTTKAAHSMGVDEYMKNRLCKKKGCKEMGRGSERGMGPKSNCIESAPVESHTMGLFCGAFLGVSKSLGMRKVGGVGEYIKQGTTFGRPAHMNKCLVGENEAGVIET